MVKQVKVRRKGWVWFVSFVTEKRDAYWVWMG